MIYLEILVILVVTIILVEFKWQISEKIKGKTIS